MSTRIPKSVREKQLNALDGKRFIRWDSEYKNNLSKAVMMCNSGHEWSATVSHLLNIGTGCPSCASNSRHDEMCRIEQLNSLLGMQFVRWYTKYRNSYTKAVMRCSDGHEWVATINDLLNSGKGCPKCAGNYRYSAEEREKQLDGLQGAKFVRWVGRYKNKSSRAVMLCGKGHEWEATINNLLNHGSSCPSCAKYGFNQCNPATLYALRSECGMFVKIGISNDFDRRHAELVRHTPFRFYVVAKIHSDGKTVRSLEKIFHGAFDSSGHSDFDGATEWLKFTPDILALMRALGD